MRIVGVERRLPMYRAISAAVAQEQALKSPFDFQRNFPQGHIYAGTGGILHSERIAEIMIELLQRFDQQKINRKPDGPAPIRVAAKKARCRFGGFITHAVLASVDGQYVRM